MWKLGATQGMFLSFGENRFKKMKEYGIDQVNTAETSKAAQRNIVEYWDNNGIADAE